MKNQVAPAAAATPTMAAPHMSPPPLPLATVLHEAVSIDLQAIAQQRFPDAH
jgi:hypothetical protein